MRFLFAIFCMGLYASSLGAADVGLDLHIRVSPRDPRYLERADGSPFIPIGLNLIAPPRADSEKEALAEFEGWLRQLSQNGGNYIRVWLSNPFWAIEHERSGVYDESRARRIDRMLDLCRRYGIRVKMTMEHFRTIGEPGKAWSDQPIHHVSRGGPAQSIADFFDGEASRAQFRRKIRWYAARYGSPPVVFGWELWNEINAVRGGDFMQWTAVMLPELRKAFPHNLVMQSLGSFDRARLTELYRRHSLLEGNDVAQVHRYLDLGAELEICRGPVDLLASDAVQQLIRYKPGKPVLLAESGAVEPNHSGPFRLYPKDRAGIILHDVLFAPFFSGAAAAGQIWHWDSYVSANRLWWHFGRFASAVKAIDPPAEQFQPLRMDAAPLRIYVLDGRRIALLWCRDARNTWESELRDGIAAAVVRHQKLDLNPLIAGKTISLARAYDPWKDRWLKIQVEGGYAMLPEFSRSLVLRVEYR